MNQMKRHRACKSIKVRTEYVMDSKKSHKASNNSNSTKWTPASKKTLNHNSTRTHPPTTQTTLAAAKPTLSKRATSNTQLKPQTQNSRCSHPVAPSQLSRKWQTVSSNTKGSNLSCHRQPCSNKQPAISKLLLSTKTQALSTACSKLPMLS